MRFFFGGLFPEEPVAYLAEELEKPGVPSGADNRFRAGELVQRPRTSAPSAPAAWRSKGRSTPSSHALKRPPYKPAPGARVPLRRT